MPFGWWLVGWLSLRNDIGLLDMASDPHIKAQIMQEMDRRITYKKNVPLVTPYASAFNIYLNQPYMNHSLSFTLTLGRQQVSPLGNCLLIEHISTTYIVYQRSQFYIQGLIHPTRAIQYAIECHAIMQTYKRHIRETHIMQNKATIGIIYTQYCRSHVSVKLTFVYTSRCNCNFGTNKTKGIQ